ncbi:hypothetical protein ZWY2020_013946 [Hordeum vulgare]|nr:hypothetical protein ZWY2020_013946 [Hordeum vulgare]
MDLLHSTSSFRRAGQPSLDCGSAPLVAPAGGFFVGSLKSDAQPRCKPAQPRCRAGGTMPRMRRGRRRGGADRRGEGRGDRSPGVKRVDGDGRPLMRSRDAEPE